MQNIASFGFSGDTWALKKHWKHSVTQSTWVFQALGQLTIQELKGHLDTLAFKAHSHLAT